MLYLLSLLLLTSVCKGQQRPIKLTIASSTGEKSHITFSTSKKGDSLIISNGTIFRLTIQQKTALLITGTDTLKIAFKDQGAKVIVGIDTYLLYPKFYTQFKQAVLVNKSVMSILYLLEDQIGDYPLQPVIPLILFSPQTEKRIRSATVITRRSQADMSDTWTCTYRYNNSEKLVSVSAENSEELRFSKKISYNNAGISTIITYLSLETRQITDRIISYPANNTLNYHQKTLETGKNRESEYSVTIKKSMK